VKVIDLRPLRLSAHFSSKRLLREVEIMRSISHVNVIRLIEVFENDDFVKIVMELATGKELFDLIIARHQYSEADAQPIFNQIASALSFLHSKGIVHRDIKPENVIVSDNTGCVKLLDFGLAKATTSAFGSTAKTFVGTPCYLAPEVENVRDNDNGYGVQVDCWSLGAVLYVMLVARFPEFDRSSGRPLVKLTGDHWSRISVEGKELIKGLMTTDPVQRLTAEQALEHPWARGVRTFTASGAEMGSVNSHVTSHVTSQSKHTVHIETETIEKLETMNSESSVDSVNISDMSHVVNISQTINSETSVDSVNIVSDISHVVNIGESRNSENSMESLNLSDLRVPETMNSVNSESSVDSVNISDMSRVALVAVPPKGIISANNNTNNANSTHDTELIMFHRHVCQLFELAFKYQLPPNISFSRLNDTALLARRVMVETFELVGKLHDYSAEICSSLEDINLAVTEKEPILAHRFLQKQKEWVEQLRTGIGRIKSLNETLIRTVNTMISDIALVLPNTRSLPAPSSPTNSSAPSSASSTPSTVTSGSGGGEYQNLSLTKYAGRQQGDDVMSLLLVNGPPSPTRQNLHANNSIDNLGQLQQTLRKIDKELDGSSLLLSSIDIKFENMTTKSELVEEYVEYGHNPNLMRRFQTRLVDYKTYWTQINAMTTTHIPRPEHIQKMYSFVDTESK